jgi:hypothetical protein
MSIYLAIRMGVVGRDGVAVQSELHQKLDLKHASEVVNRPQVIVGKEHALQGGQLV